MARDLSVAFKTKLDDGATPTEYISILSDAGIRLYAGTKLTDAFEGQIYLYDGGVYYDGSITYGEGSTTISREALLLDASGVSRALAVTGQSRATSGDAKRQETMNVTLMDTDKILSQRFAIEPILGHVMSKWWGFSDVPATDHLQLFTGSITKMIGKPTQMIVEAVEI